MNLGIFLGIGESLSQMEKSGQRERFIDQYLKEYAKEFDKVYLFSYINESGSLPKNVILVPNKSGLHRFVYALLLALINRKQISNCNVVRGFGLTSAIPGFFLSKPFVFNWPYEYGEFLKIEKRYTLVPIFKLLEWLAFLKSSKVLVATKLKLRSLKGSKFIYLPNGVDLKVFNPSAPKGTGLVFVGRFEKQKNLFFLIDAVSSLQKKYRSITLIGIGSQEKELKVYAREKGVNLEILSPVENKELPKTLGRFSVFTLPSFSEGSPKVLLESMALGLISVVTNFRTSSEIVKDAYNGFITGYNPDDYSKRLGQLLSDKILVNKMSTNAKQTIVNNFNLETILAREIEILKEAAK